MAAGHLVFVDTAALIAVLAPATTEQRLVGQLWQFELDAGSVLVTTDYALTRASVQLQRSHGSAGLRLLHEVVAPALHVEWCTRADHDRAVAALLASGPGGPDLFGCVDEQTKRRLKIRTALRWD